MRATIMVLDSFGVGAMPDAAEWGDAGADTLGHIAERVGGLHLPNLERLGLGNIHPAPGLSPETRPLASWGRMAIASDGKDTIAGHWEMAGFPVAHRFGVYPEGFPDDVIRELAAFAGAPVLGNKAASGTAILDEFGLEHQRTGGPIVYTSADSVLQIAAHEQVMPLERLYALCERAFDLVQPLNVVRVIARPFVGEPGAYVRTGNRKDFAQEPGGPTLMDRLQAAGFRCVGVGKIPSIYGHRGFDRELHAGHNPEILDETLRALDEEPEGLVFANLVDLDAMYGHRRDPQGYAAALRAIDARIPELLERMRDDDLLCFIADHGCDPTHPGSDHTREYVPMLAYRRGGRGEGIGTRASLADLGQTLCDWFRVPWLPHGTSFAEAL
jgi:phosphopentomutase